MKEFINYLVSLIVDNPQDVEVSERILDEKSIQYIISANEKDIGKIIGKGGKIIQAIRNIVKVLAVKHDKQVRIEVA
ncbi:hypothetical protein A3D77_02875 [Candidatus Gottesmanbacteria bacterium RIFCSPHIGHO2_02_FULL_39_11]|uniref:RNA-binding protein KhpA n=1 Tax=Candidatus Gottesmanbacteria bacterium RIFCSPHIGHO2_02_FULL_39_11 TaxID=1798382 RepID=A0A1F5ZTF7_9BACT|nr:MAG: hypothetical protein A3D77_02875 [Candidatus Gottesmanbacteria bacterium RIFCSPHIGHO2_02_FULL_39_11]